MFEVTEYGPGGRFAQHTMGDEEFAECVMIVLVGFHWVARDRWVVSGPAGLVWHVVLLAS